MNNSFEETNNSKDKGKPNDAIDLFKMNNMIMRQVTKKLKLTAS